MLVKILGAIDIVAAIAFLLMLFGAHIFTPYLLFCAGLLFLKGLFIVGGEPLSVIDLISSGTLIYSIFLVPASFFLWTLSLLLIAKGIVSFI